MNSRATIPDREDIGDDTPLRLDVVAKLAFPDGSITGRSLEREAQRGNLDVEIIAGKTFTTLADIAKMRARCRVRSNPQGSTSAVAAPIAAPSGSSSTEESNTALARARTISRKLKMRSATSSQDDTDRTSAKVIPIKS